MKKILIPLLSLVLLAPLPLRAQQIPFGDGEELSYTIHYKYGISADLASLDINGVREGGAYHITAHINTFRFWDSFYKMRDLYESTFDYEPGLRPISAYRDVEEGGYWAKCRYTWNQNPSSLRAVIDKKNRPHRDTVLKEKETIRDIFNMIYYCRAADYAALQKGKKVHSVVAMDRSIYNVTVRCAGREKKKTGGKTFNTVKLAISIKASGSDLNDVGTAVSLGDSESDFDGGEKMWFWVTDDDNRLPVFFSANLKVGAIQGRLTKVSGNRFPFTSIIE